MTTFMVRVPRKTPANGEGTGGIGPLAAEKNTQPEEVPQQPDQLPTLAHEETMGYENTQPEEYSQQPDQLPTLAPEETMQPDQLPILGYENTQPEEESQQPDQLPTLAHEETRQPPPDPIVDLEIDEQSYTDMLRHGPDYEALVARRQVYTLR